VRMIVPPVLRRREMDRQLVKFFHEHRSAAFRRAVTEFCRFYSVRRPRIEWYEYIDWGKTAGKTFEDGRIHLVHPENWKRGRVYKSERMWVQTVYHELAHYLFWSDAERKAEAFTHRMVRGLRRIVRVRRIASGARRSPAMRAKASPRRVRSAAAARSPRLATRQRKSVATPYRRGGRRCLARA
jgi:hypothetical protein